jgi:hypothetical protein
MSNINENQGYAVEGRLKETAKGYLALWSINAGRMRYSDLVTVAKRNGLTQGQIPKLRTAKNAFAVAKDTILNSALPTLLELDGWDGAVKQSLDVKHLRRGNEYQVSVRREGRMHGKLHKESSPVFRLEFSPPDAFDHVAWVQNYMRSFWDAEYIKEIEAGTKQRPVPSQTRVCIRIEGYWDDSDIDVELMLRVRDRISQAFEDTIVSIDETLLRQHIKETLKSLNGISFLAGKGATYIPITDENRDSKSASLESMANIITSFSRGYQTTANDENYYDENGKPINRYGTSSNFRYLGYLDSEREMQYIREDLGSSISREIAEFQAEVVKTAASFDTTKVELFEKQLTKLQRKKTNITKRIGNMRTTLGGEIPIRRRLHSDVQQRFGSRISNITQTHNAVSTTLMKLTEFDN